LGVLADANFTVWLGSPPAIRDALFKTPFLAVTMAAVVLGHIAWATARGRRAVGRKGVDWKGRWMTTASELIPPTLLRLAVAEMTVIRTALFRWGGHRRSLLKSEARSCGSRSA
jgi:hypothetical protein